MDIVVCTDSNYIMPCGVMLYSICKNNIENNISFHIIIDDSVKNNQIELLNKEISIFSDQNKNIYLYNIIERSLGNLPRLDDTNPKKHITKAAYYRLFISNILPTTLDKVLYLDCDIIVRGSLNRLWNTDLNDKSIAAVPDAAEGVVDKYNRLRYSFLDGYFNSGVLLINLKKWRDNNIVDKFTGFMQSNPDSIKLHDQDVLNWTFYNDKINLPITYNLQEGYLWKEMYYDYWKYEKEVIDARNNPIIIHYTDSKPWKEGCEHPWKDEFFCYQQETEWANTPIISNKPKTVLIRLVKCYIRKIFETIGIMTPYPKYPSKYIITEQK